MKTRKSLKFRIIFCLIGVIVNQQSKYLYLLPFIIGLGIFFGTVITYLQISEYQQQLSQSYKDEVHTILKKIIDKEENRLQTVSNSMIAFFESSNEVTPDEFKLFSDKIFDSNPELVNVSIIDENKIIVYSYPQNEMTGENFDILFPSHPTQINGIKTMNIEFPMNNMHELVISVPFDYFISHDMFPNQSFKLILFSPLDNNLKLYQVFSNLGIVETNDVEFTQHELENVAEVVVQTNLHGHTIKKDYVLRYMIWNSAFESNISSSQFLLIFGIIASFVIPFVIYKTTNALRQKIQERSQILEQKNIELEQIKKSKDEFVTMIVHDLKNPLVPIISLSDILLSNTLGDLNPKQTDRINMIRSNATYLQNLIDDLLDSQKAELGKLRLTFTENNLSEILYNSILKIMPEFDIKEITIETNIANNVQCICDKIRIEQVLSNLLFNSLDFVSAKIGKLTISLESNDHTAKIIIKDNGIGIEKDQLDKLFVKFYQIKNNLTRKYGGTGLGLAVSNDIITLHGGKIWVESDGIGKGSTFFIELPLKDLNKTNVSKEK